MKILMALFLLSGFCFKSHGIVFYKQDKARGPGKATFKDFDIASKSYKNKRKWILNNHNDYPWGVCFPEGKHNFEQKHLNWTWQAMEEWNDEYDDFLSIHKHNTLVPSEYLHFPFDVSRIFIYPKDYHVAGWPSKLLVWSCDKEYHNLVYPVFAPTKVNKETKRQALAYYQPHNPWFNDFYGSIVMSNNVKEENGKIKVWKKHHFINVMMHELGHLLGLPHLNPEETNIMAQWGFGCREGGHGEVCSLTSGDFNSFLSIFKSRGKHIRDLVWEKEQEARLRKSKSNISWEDKAFSECVRTGSVCNRW